jgi:ligand-binding SRPBCC domain-containing protein
MLYRLVRPQKLPISVEKAWEFFCDPRNLALITPPDLDFKVTSEVPAEIYPGLIISYKVRPLFSIPTTWVTEISHVRAPNFFVDTQVVGPYRLWHHEHELIPIDGGVLMHDRVSFVPPFGLLGDIVYHLVIKKRLEQIFDYRYVTLEKRFGIL